MKHLIIVLLVLMTGLCIVSCENKSTSPDEGQVASPIITPNGGSFDSVAEVTITCPTPGAEIKYTIDGSEPTSSSTLYANALILGSDTTLKVKAYKAGWLSSPTKTATFNFTSVAQPQIYPPGASFTEPQIVSLSSTTPNARIHYSIDGSIPSTDSPLYTGTITVSRNTTIKAIAFLDDKIPSPMTSEIYKFQVLDPALSPLGGSFATAQIVSITCPTPSAKIYYTLDGSEPTEESLLYTQALSIISNTIVRAKAYRDGWDPSAKVIAAYHIQVPDQMVLVSAGTFHNGVANVTLTPYYISKYEVTQFDWYMVIGTDPSFYPIEPEGVFATLPVESVTWMEAIAYCNLKSLSDGYTPCYSYGVYGTNPSNWPNGWRSKAKNHENVSCNWDANGYRLPTEMEWMFAAMGGNFSMGYLYSGSNSIDAVAWYAGNSEGKTQNIGEKQPNELGTFDMSGNVWEYCWDIYGPYPTTDQINPVGAKSGPSRVMRGGSCLQDESNSTVARRYSTYPDFSTNIHGFRVARKGQ